MNRYVFVFRYDGWMVVCYEDGRNKMYFNCDEDDWNVALSYVDLFLSNGGNQYWYALPDYDTIAELDIFKLKNKPIDELSKYLNLKYTKISKE